MEPFTCNKRRRAAVLLGALIISSYVFISCNKVQANQNNNQAAASKGNPQDQILSGPLKFIGSWGTRGTDPGQFQSPEWLAIDATGNVFVADAGAKAVEKFTFDGHPLMSFNDAQVAEPFRVAVDAGAGIYALSRNANAFYIFRRRASHSGISQSPRRSRSSGRWVLPSIRTAIFSLLSLQAGRRRAPGKRQ